LILFYKNKGLYSIISKDPNFSKGIVLLNIR